MVAAQQIPESDGMGLQRTADHQNGAVQHRQYPLRLRREIHMAGGVHQGDGPVGGFQPCLLGEDGDASCPLQVVGIQKGVGVVNTAQRPAGAAHIQQRLREGGLACVYMGQQTNAERMLVWLLIHDSRPPLQLV